MSGSSQMSPHGFVPTSLGEHVALLHGWGIEVEQESPQMHNTNMVACICGPSTWKGEIGLL